MGYWKPQNIRSAWSNEETNEYTKQTQLPYFNLVFNKVFILTGTIFHFLTLSWNQVREIWKKHQGQTEASGKANTQSDTGFCSDPEPIIKREAYQNDLLPFNLSAELSQRYWLDWLTVISLSSHCRLEGKCTSLHELTDKRRVWWSKNRHTDARCLLFFTTEQLIYSILDFWCEKTNNLAAN